MSGGVTLVLDAAATTGTIAVVRDGRLLAESEVAMRSDAEDRYLPAILATLARAQAPIEGLERVVCGEGPGSFTSLRVAAAIGKGLAQGLGLPLFAVPSLALIVAGSEATRGGGRWLATLDAMRGDRYVALVTVGAAGDITGVDGLGLAPASEVEAMAARHAATPIGPAEKLAATPHARGFSRLASLVDGAGPVDLASWEPRYGRLAEAQVKWEAAHGRSL